MDAHEIEMAYLMKDSVHIRGTMNCFRSNRKPKSPDWVYEEIEKRQRQTGLREFMARRDVKWTQPITQHNVKMQSARHVGRSDTRVLRGQIINNLT